MNLAISCPKHLTKMEIKSRKVIKNNGRTRVYLEQECVICGATCTLSLPIKNEELARGG